MRFGADGSRNSLEEAGGLDRAMTSYDPPRGNPRFLEAIAGLFRDTFGWEIGPENIAITPGGQTAFFFLFNLLAGRMPDGCAGKKSCCRSCRNTSATRIRASTAACSTRSLR